MLWGTHGGGTWYPDQLYVLLSVFDPWASGVVGCDAGVTERYRALAHSRALLPVVPESIGVET